MATTAHGVAPGLEATHFFQPPDIVHSSGAHVALAEVDPETMHVRLRGYRVSHDSGRLIKMLWSVPISFSTTRTWGHYARPGGSRAGATGPVSRSQLASGRRQRPTARPARSVRGRR